LAAVLTLLAASGQALAQEPEVSGIDAFVNAAVQPVADVIVGVIFYTVPVLGADMPLIVLWLVVAAAIATVYFNFIAFRAFKHALELIRGDYSNPEDAGEVSHFQALATALSGTVGLGNIAGVAIAVSIGGPGATFWMVIAGLLGLSL
jgi:AGCS family alanine or glycine:cation symporter